VRVQSLLNPDAEVKHILTLTPALSRRERVVFTSGHRLMPMTLTPALSRRERVSYTSRGRFMSMTFTTVLELRPVI
jgi:hypothetical protein